MIIIYKMDTEITIMEICIATVTYLIVLSVDLKLTVFYILKS